MTTYPVSGVTSTGITLNSGDVMSVYAGGSAVDTTVNSGGTELVFSGGTTVSTTVSGGGSAVLDGQSAIASDTIATGHGYLLVSSGGSAISTTLSAGGYDNVSGGGIASFTMVSAGSTESVGSGGTSISATVDGGGTEFVHSTGIVSDTTVNDGGSAVLYGNNASAVDTTVNNGGYEIIAGGSATSTTLADGGSINLVFVPYVSGATSASVNSSGLLTVSAGSEVYQQQLGGNYAHETFMTTSQFEYGDVFGTLVTAEVPCFRRGTRILTERGEVAVEDLRVGDRVRTVLGVAASAEAELGAAGTGGTAAPIIWIGQREVECGLHPKPRQVWPVRVAADAFGPGQPHTELFLSPDHAVFVNEVLIPIRHLINGSTITQVPVDHVIYYHIELPDHDVLLAQGLPAESFLDMKDGSNYASRPGPTRLFTDYAVRMWEAFGCARLVVTGPELEAAKLRVNARVAAHVAA